MHVTRGPEIRFPLIHIQALSIETAKRVITAHPPVVKTFSATICKRSEKTRTKNALSYLKTFDLSMSNNYLSILYLPDRQTQTDRRTD